MTIKKGDFVEITFVGRIKETNQIFDLTDEGLAKKENIHNPNSTYGPKIICVGQHQLVKGIDDFLEGKEINKKYIIEITPEQGFGKKDARLMKIVPSSIFKKQNIKPFPGLQLNVDGKLGVVRTVSGGRNIVDFNHPLAGRNLVYEVEITKIVTDLQEQLKSYLHSLFGDKAKGEVKEGKAVITADFTEQLQKPLEEQLKKIIQGIKTITFETSKKAEKKETTTQA